MKSPAVIRSCMIGAVLFSPASLVTAQNTTASTGHITTPQAKPSAPANPGPFQFATEPKGAKDAVLARILVEAPAYPYFTVRDPANLQVEGPLCLYNLSTISAIDGLLAAQASGWCYFVEASGKVYALAYVHVDRMGRTMTPDFSFSPDFPWPTLEQLSALDQVKTGSFEPRFIQSNPEGLEAVWFKSTTGGADYVYVMMVAKPGIEAKKVYARDEFLKLLRGIVEKRAMKPSTPGIPRAGD